MPTTCISEYLLATTNVTDQNVKKVNAGYGKTSIDIGAYGESTYSTYINNSYRFFGGTSAAAPQVTGTVGLLYSLPCSHLDELALTEPAKAALEVKSIIMQSVKSNASLNGITVSGGVLNVFNAINKTSPIQIQSIATDQLECSWREPAIYPIQFRYRKLGQTLWKDTIIYQGNAIIFTKLESCTDYELQIKIYARDMLSIFRYQNRQKCGLL
ncbi:MAG: hypothetical protein IPM92_07970 [Saprospiraceae bacterium]|nr:hypothetical protein [Saprospiraceae bacterium]